MPKPKPIKIERIAGAPEQADYERAQLEKMLNGESRLHAADGMRISAMHLPPRGSLAGHHWAIYELLVTLLKQRK